MNIFEVATQHKLRFQTPKGKLSVEDIWDLSLDELDKIAVEIDNNMKLISKSSYLSKKNRETGIDKNFVRFEILMHVIKHKEDLISKNERQAVNTQQLEMISKIIQDKKNEQLRNMSVEELEALIKKQKELDIKE